MTFQEFLKRKLGFSFTLQQKRECFYQWVKIYKINLK